MALTNFVAMLCPEELKLFSGRYVWFAR